MRTSHKIKREFCFSGKGPQGVSAGEGRREGLGNFMSGNGAKFLFFNQRKEDIL
jgi:hypothetical protein